MQIQRQNKIKLQLLNARWQLLLVLACVRILYRVCECRCISQLDCSLNGCAGKRMNSDIEGEGEVHWGGMLGPSLAEEQRECVRNFIGATGNDVDREDERGAGSTRRLLTCGCTVARGTVATVPLEAMAMNTSCYFL